MNLYWLMLGILCVWRITHLLNKEDGPRDIFFRFRQSVGNGFWGNLLDCFYCLSMWISLPFGLWIGNAWDERILLWLSFSAGAIIIERVTHYEQDKVTPHYFEDKEK